MDNNLSNPDIDHRIIRNINYYETRTPSRLIDEQACYIPCVEEDQIECVVTTYLMGRKRHIIDQYKYICLRLKYLRFRSNINKKIDVDGSGLHENTYMYINENTPMIELVKYGVIQPFALFINGRFIPWDIISISITPNVSYILIDISKLAENGDEGKGKEFSDLISEKDLIKYAQIITLPTYMTFSTNGESITQSNVICSFDKKGLLSSTQIKYSLIVKDNMSPHLCTSYLHLGNGDMNSTKDISKSLQDMSNQSIELSQVHLTDKNALLFKNGRLAVGKKINIKRGFDFDYLDKKNYEDFSPYIEMVTVEGDLGENPTIRFDNLNMTITDNKKNLFNQYADTSVFAIYHLGIDVSDLAQKGCVCKISLKENGTFQTGISFGYVYILPGNTRTNATWFQLNSDTDFRTTQANLLKNAAENYIAVLSTSEVTWQRIIDNYDIRIESAEDNAYDCKLYINTDYSNSINAIDIASNSFVQTVVSDVNQNGNNSQYKELYDIMKTPFDTTMDRDTDFDTNVVAMINSMLKYNSNLFKETFKRNSNLEITEYTGEWVNKNKRVNNSLFIPIRHKNLDEEFVIMLVNGELYKYDHAIKRHSSYCVIPITGIKDTDHIEFLRFRNINNYTFDITINKDDEPAYYSSDFINKNMVLFSNEPDDDDPYSYPVDGKQYLPVDYNLKVNDEGLTKITLTNEFYYGKKLKAAYKNRYVHAQYIIPDSDEIQYSIDLKDRFSYCTDYNKFLVFHNGRKVDSNLYKIVLPSTPTTPFYEFRLYFSIKVEAFDKIDVIYVPSLMQDIVYMAETEDLSGNIVVDKDILNYGISTDLFIVWINGKKIPASSIKDIGENRMHIISNEQSTKNLIITKYIPDIDELIESFKSNTSLWDQIISKLSQEDIYKLLGFTPKGLSDNENDIYEGANERMKELSLALILEQYAMNYRVDITDKFVYDYLYADEAKEYNESGEIVFGADANTEYKYSDSTEEE